MIIIFKLRTFLKETPIYLQICKYHPNRRQSLIFKIIVASLFFGIISGVPTKVFNALLPISMGITSVQIMLINTITLFFYAALLIFAGMLSDRYSIRKIMVVTMLITGISAYPLIMLLTSGLWLAVVIVKISFMTFAAFFIGPFHAWAQSLASPNTRYQSISVSYTIGKCISTLILALIFVAYKYFDNIQILGYLLSVISIFALLSLSSVNER